MKSRGVPIQNEDGRKKSDQRSKRMSAKLKNSAREAIGVGRASFELAENLFAG